MLFSDFGASVHFLCSMPTQVEQIETEIVKRIYKLFLVKFNGNKSEFARVSKCSETTVRRVLGGKQRMTLDLLLRMCHALNIDIDEIFAGLSLHNKL